MLGFRSPLQPIDKNRESFFSITKAFSTKKKEVPTPAPAAPTNASNSPLPMDISGYGLGMAQIGDYDVDMHLPKYSQSEMDAAMEENASIIAELTSKLNQVQVSVRTNEQSDTSMNTIIEDLQKQLYAEKESRKALTEKIDEFCLVRAQNKALNHRLSVLETELLEKDEEHAAQIAYILAEEARRLKASQEKAQLELSQAYDTAKKEVKAKAVAQFEAGNAKFNEIKQDFKELRAKYDERMVELKVVKEELEAVRQGQETEVLLSQSRANEVSELRAQLEVLKQDKSTLIAASVTAQTTLAQMQEAMNKLRDEMFAEKASASTARVMVTDMENEMRSIKLELEGQMNAVAKVSSAKNAVEKQLEAAQSEVIELTARCKNLREMNKEMLGMLEGQK